MDKLHEFEKIIGYTYKDITLLQTALTHSSYINENKDKNRKDNERFEFFGDAIIEFYVSSYLFEKYRDFPEGDLTKLRASMVCEPSLALCAKNISLGDYLYMGKGEESSGGRERDSITSDAFEALVASVYLDAGKQTVAEFINKHLLSVLKEDDLFFDSKTRLQEIVQQMDGASLSYEVINEEGPSHAKVFEAAVYLNGKETGRGKGHSKKAAQQQAAENALENMGQTRQ